MPLPHSVLPRETFERADAMLSSNKMDNDLWNFAFQHSSESAIKSLGQSAAAAQPEPSPMPTAQSPEPLPIVVSPQSETRMPNPQVMPGAGPPAAQPQSSAMPSNAPQTGAINTSTITSGPRPDQQLRPGESVGSVTLGDGPTSAGGEIDNSSRESFVRTAWPYMLQAAGGDQNLAELMLAKAISENGSIGTGKPFWANNFSGIKGEGDAGSVEADTWEDYGNGPVNIRDRFAAYSTPQKGIAAFMNFLRNNERYHPALAAYQQSGDADQLFRDILGAGYATDKQWADKVQNIRATQVAPIVRQVAGDPRQSMNAGSGLPAPEPAPAAGAGAPPPSAPALPPTVASMFKQANGREPTPEEARELMGAFGRMA